MKLIKSEILRFLPTCSKKIVGRFFWVRKKSIKVRLMRTLFNPGIKASQY